jgi:hypothetical protein
VIGGTGIYDPVSDHGRNHHHGVGRRGLVATGPKSSSTMLTPLEVEGPGAA